VGTVAVVSAHGSVVSQFVADSPSPESSSSATDQAPTTVDQSEADSPEQDVVAPTDASSLAAEIGTYSEIGYRSGYEHQQWTNHPDQWKSAAQGTDIAIDTSQYKPWFAAYHNGKPGTIVVDQLRMYGLNRSTNQWEYLESTDASIGGAYWDPNWGSGSGLPGDGGGPEVSSSARSDGAASMSERGEYIIHGWNNGLSGYDEAVYDGYLITMEVSADREGHTIGMGLDQYTSPSEFVTGLGISAPWSVPVGTARVVGVTNRPDLLKSGIAPF